MGRTMALSEGVLPMTRLLDDGPGYIKVLQLLKIRNLKLDPLEAMVLKQVVDKYFVGNHFNGFPLHYISTVDKDFVPEFKKIVIRLLKKNMVDINFGDRHPNFYIKAFDLGPRKEQLRKIKSTDNFCIYPSKEFLRKIVKKERYVDKPFSYLMALGEPQLAHYPFDL